MNQAKIKNLTLIDLKLLFGLLFYSSVLKSNYENICNGCEIFRCIMSETTVSTSPYIKNYLVNNNFQDLNIRFYNLNFINKKLIK